jgi:diadenosine tetraphosphatase ApaH/serine/threonine PP2A family protein phosphatase
MADDDVQKEFGEAVNMTAGQLEEWLDTDESKTVGQKDGGGESTGHASGRRIIELLGRKKAELTDDDRDHMRKVVGYVHRHLAQRPKGDVEDTKWRYSLMNWGHDPLKD